MSETWERAKKIFQHASELPSAERGTYLDAACEQDAALRREVQALLAAQEDAGSFLGGDADTLTPIMPLTEGSGTVVGRYKLLQQIGEGGFGTVYMAEQERPVRRKVALKIIKLGMDTRQVIARFEAERQALALMDHPNIARVLDAGSTETGRPFFVMELVRGVPITKYCDENNLSTHERLDLFLGVCGAVQHAHQKGIIHRDIKPSNVMVTLHDGTPVPKVIDFGIAKATNQRLTEKTLFTQYHQFIGTPQYMSPEQAEMSGLDVDTRTDIYSLGVLLYELLTGTTPVDPKRLNQMAYSEIHRFIREDDPQRPSTRVSTMGDAATATAKHRATDARALSRALSGDLDWIVLKALEKDRTRRYETANAFIMDVRRHLDDEPVLASPPTPAYRLRKFVRRNRTAVSVAAVVCVALLGGLGAATYGFLQADHERAIAHQEAEASEQINAFFTDMLASVNPLQLHLHTAFSPSGRAPDAGATFEHGVSVHTMLMSSIDRIDGAFPGKPLLEARARETIATTLLGLGASDDAISQFEATLELRRQVLPENDRDVLRSRLLVAQGEDASLRLVRAEAISRSVWSTLETRFGPDDPLTLAAASVYAATAGNQAKFAFADSLYEITLERQRRVLGSDHRDTIRSLVEWAGLYCWRGHKRAEELASEAYERAARAYSPDDAIVIAAASRYALSLTFQRRDDEAKAIIRPTLVRARRVFGDEHPMVGELCFGLIRALDWTEDAEEMEALYRGAGLGGANWVGTRDWGNFLVQQDRLDEAVAVFAEQHAFWSVSDQSEHVGHERLEVIKGGAFRNYRRSLTIAGRTDELRVLVAERIDDLAELAESEDATPSDWEQYAWELVSAEPTDLRDPEKALVWSTRAMSALAPDDDPTAFAATADTHAKALELNGRIEEALAAERRALEVFYGMPQAEKRTSQADPQYWSVQAVRYATELGDDAAARAIVSRAMEETESIHGADNSANRLGELGRSLGRRGFLDLSEAPRRRALEVARSEGRSSEVLTALIQLAALQARRSHAEEAVELIAEAEALFAELYVTEAIEWREGMGYAEQGERSRAAVDAKVYLAYACVQAGQLDRADELVKQIWCSSTERSPRTTADLHLKRGDAATAETHARRAYNTVLKWRSRSEEPGMFAYVEAQLGRCLAALGRYDEAEKHLLAGHARAFEWGGPRSQSVIDITGWIEDLYTDWGKSEFAAEWRGER